MRHLKYLLLTISFHFLAATYVDAAEGILRKDDGSPRYMNHYDAMKACPAGTHLPTIREFTMESQARGAKGILELNQVNPDLVPTGYFKISAFNPRGPIDEFYYNDKGYKGVEEDHYYFFWSSSVYSYGAFVFYGDNGHVRNFDRLMGGGVVRCVRNY